MEVKILRRPEVEATIGVSTATLYRMMNRGEFPRPVKLSPGCVGWRKADVLTWLDSREAVS